MNSSSSRCLVALSLLLLSACGDDGTFLPIIDASSPMVDGAPTVDGGSSDGGALDVMSTTDAATDSATDASAPDAQEPEADLYESCAETECREGLRCNTGAANPYCTMNCELFEDCAAGVCAFGQCEPTCEPGERQCDAFGGACTTAPGFDHWCYSTCNDSQPGFRCPGSLVCDAHQGACVERIDSRGGDVGDPCGEHDDCRSGVCQLSSEGFPDGSCIAFTRRPSAFVGPNPRQLGCPAGSRAVEDPSSSLGVGDIVPCAKSCTSECRDGYSRLGLPGATLGFCLETVCDPASSGECPAGRSCRALDGVDGGRCFECVPQCDGLSCGHDSCGGVCGACASDESCSAGQCECVPRTDAQLCSSMGHECGRVNTTDNCGQARSLECGTCAGNFTCGLLAANQCDCTPEADATLCANSHAECGTLRVTDRCGASRNISCGGCSSPETCRSNRCEVCTPSCSGRECGSDGCGGFCGSCTGGDVCSSGQCVFDDDCDPVRNTGCSGGNECLLLSNEETRCAVMGSRLQGRVCSSTTDCAGGYGCFGTCRKICRVGSDAICGAGEVCGGVVGWSTYGACTGG